jgi:Spy/CpxP family protein refolding chaperone
MKRVLVRLMICALVVFSLAIASPAQALLLADTATSTATETVKDLLTQLENEVLPKLETILTPEQREQFAKFVSDGGTFRKAFKSLTLTPDQKTKLKEVLSSLPKKDAFASLTPEQKKKLFMQKKDFFKPTAEEIADKINQGMKMKGGTMPEGIKEQINAKLKGIQQFMPE